TTTTPAAPDTHEGAANLTGKGISPSALRSNLGGTDAQGSQRHLAAVLVSCWRRVGSPRRPLSADGDDRGLAPGRQLRLPPMSWRLRLETQRVTDRLEHGDPYWPAQLAVGVAIALNLVLTERVTVGPSWLLAAVEGVLLVALV